MKVSLISKINKPLLVVALVSIFAIVATKAYFTASADSPENMYISGSIALDISQDSVLSVSNWIPGEEHVLEFHIENTGSMPIYLKGYLSGEWDDEMLNPNMFVVSSLERLVDGYWIDMTQDVLLIDNEFYISADGTENSLLMMSPEEIESFRMTTHLAEDVTDEYQNKVFTTSLHIAAKQVQEGANWPLDY